MFQKQSFNFSPASIPKIVKYTIIFTLILSFFSLISHSLFTTVLGLPSPQYLFSLTTWGIHNFFLWQFISYLFIQPVINGGISISMLIHIFFDIYLLSAMGSAIVKTKGKKHFFGLYFGGGLFVGIVAYIFLLSAGSTASFSGATPCIYMLLIGWVFLFPGANLSLFLFIPIRAKWLVFGIIGINLFLDFSNGNFFYFFVTASALIYAYFYSILSWEILSPFPQLHKIEQKTIYLKRRFKRRFYQIIGIKVYSSNVYDFKTKKKTIQEHEFIDICLEKISTKGKNTLTMRERFRMWRISKKNS